MPLAGNQLVFSDLPAPIDSGHVAVLTLRFEGQVIGSATDWAPSNATGVFVRQRYPDGSGSVYTFGASFPMTTARAAYQLQHTFSLVAGKLIDVGWFCGFDASISGRYWNWNFLAEIVRR